MFDRRTLYIASISNINAYGEWRINGNVALSGATSVGNLYMNWGGLYLNGNSLNVTSKIYTSAGVRAKIYGDGVLTSSSGILDISVGGESLSGTNENLYIQTVIANNGRTEVGLRLAGNNGPWSAVILGGNRSNTFSGNVDISGKSTTLTLNKEGGATAIRGNIVVRDNAKLTLWRGNQIADTSTVRLADSIFQFAALDLILAQDLSESFHRLIVGGESILEYTGTRSGRRFIYLDDLSISNNGRLLVAAWKEGKEYLLVRKNSKHLYASLSRIKFGGFPAGWHGGLKDFNKDYWQIIPGLPEPSTYGAIFASGVLGLALWQRRRRERKNRSGTLDDVLM